jgi:hypothetical protein
MGLAAAIAAVLGCGAAQAADVTATEYDVSAQGLFGAGVGDTLTTSPIAVELGADYAVNDTITLTFTGGNVDETAPPAVVCAGASALLVTFINSPSANAFNYRVTFKNALIDSTGDVCTWGPFTVRADSLTAASDLTVLYTARATVPNLPLDEAGDRVATLFDVYDQFLNDLDTPFDATVDVESGRLSFVGAPDEDQLIIDVDNVASAIPYTPDIVADLDSITIVVNGDFSFAGCGLGFNPGLLTVAGGIAPSVSVATNCLSATIQDDGPLPGPGNSWDYTLTAVGGGGGILDAPQTFTAVTSFAFDSYYGETDTDDHPYGAGAWALNGFSAFVPYMPYGAGISQIIYITNKSNQSSALDIESYDANGFDCDFTTTVQADAGSVTQLSGDIMAGLKACYGTPVDGTLDARLSLQITGSIPGSLAEVVTSYNVNGNRNVVINNSNGKAGGTTAIGPFQGTYKSTLGGNL